MTNDRWRPSASIKVLQKRADVLATIRQFFADQQVLEVETGLLSQYSVTDPYMDAIAADNPLGDIRQFYLQTSPEYAMKRLLAAGSGPIYQLCKAFRRGEKGSRHNPEFTMLEWYRPGFDDVRLMTEVESLVNKVLGSNDNFERLSYRQVFQRYLAIDIDQLNCAELQALACSRLDVQMESDNRDDWLNLMLAELVEPKLGFTVPTFVYDYPASQSALAKVVNNPEGKPVAKRFELYVEGIELANGYDELTDAVELEGRFRGDQEHRSAQALTAIESDSYLLAAMAEGIPRCAGVALGVDRLLMVAVGAKSIAEVLAFDISRC